MELLPCAGCRVVTVRATKAYCDRCARLVAIGVLVDVVVRPRVSRKPHVMDALDAIAFLLIERHQLVRAHRRELFDEQRDAQRGPRDSYPEGLAEGRGQEW